MGRRYEDNRMPEEYTDFSGGEFDTASREFQTSAGEFAGMAGEFPERGEENPETADRPAGSGAGKAKSGKIRQAKLIRRMGYYVAASVSVVSVTGAFTLEEKETVPEWGEVVENNSLSSVTSVLTGAGIQAKIVVHADRQNGRKVKTVKCDEAGNFQLELSRGTYVLEISAEGYVKEFFDLEIQEDDTVVESRYTLTPALGRGQFRIVLEWNEIPRDLDSHLYGQLDDGRSLHVYYQYKTEMDGAKYLVTLDRDDTDSYGPETTTIYATDGVYSFKVHDYINGWDASSGYLQDSGAVVKLYQYGSDQPKIYRVPAGAGFWWYVFDIDHGVVRDVNSRSESGK